MFIMVLFGYKQSKIFTIDCLTSTLLDYIWATCVKELYKRYAQRQEEFVKEIGNHQKELQEGKKKLVAVEEELKEEEANNPAKNDKKAAKKGKDVVLSPVEQKKADLQKDIEFRQNAIIKYKDKITKLKDNLLPRLNELSEKMNKKEIVIDLVDKNGDRKFAKSKATTEATSFLTDRTTYYLGYVPVAQQEEEDAVEIVQTEGYPIRFVEEDATASDELFQPKKKDDKKKKKK